MIADLIIDGIDIGDNFGAYIEDDGLKGLFAYPSLKPPVTVDYAEMDGVSVDYSALKLDSRTFALKLVLIDSTKGAALYSFLTGDGANTLHTYTLPNLGYSKNLRLVGCSDLSYVNVFSKMELSLADDNPLSGYSYLSPLTTIASTTPYDWMVGGVNSKEYGIEFLEGSISELRKMPLLKQTQSVNSRFLPGQTTFTGIAKYQTMEKSFKLFLRAATITEFWRNYNAFLYDLTRNQELTISCYTLGSDIVITGYYKASSIELLSFYGRIWCIFELTINAVRTLNLTNTDAMLTDESDFYYMASEDEENVYLQLELDLK